MTTPTDTAAPPPAAAPEATGGDTAATEPGDLEPHGVTWEGPLAILSTLPGAVVASSDGRVVTADGGVIRPLPQVLSWQKSYSHGSLDNNDEVVAVGRILACEVRADPELGTVLWGSGDYLDPMLCYDAQQAMEQVEAGIGMVSVDLALRAVGYCSPDGQLVDPGFADPGAELYEVALEWELGGATLVTFPAFAGARIHNLAPPTEELEAEPVAVNTTPLGTAAYAAADATPAISEDGTSVVLGDGSTVEVGDAVGYPEGVGTLAGIDAGAQSVTVTPPPDAEGAEQADVSVPVGQLTPAAAAPPAGDEPGSMADLMAAGALQPYNAAYFKQRELPGPTPLTVNPDTGEVYGHAAEWGECHIGKLAETGQCVTAPHSLTEYADFHLAPVPTDEGPVYVGKITLDTGHAASTPPAFAAARAGYAPAVAHYDNTGAQVAVIRAYDDEYGIQVAGQVIHGTPPDRVAALMRSPLSGDWRLRLVNTPRGPVENLEMCAALAVNVPGFMVRPRVGMVGGKQVSLVAAGVVQPQPDRARDSIALPSGTTIASADFEALVAAMTDTLARQQRPKVSGADGAAVLALARVRARARLSA